MLVVDSRLTGGFVGVHVRGHRGSIKLREPAARRAYAPQLLGKKLFATLSPRVVLPDS